MRSNLPEIAAPRNSGLSERRVILGSVAALNVAGLAFLWHRFALPSGELVGAPLVMAAGFLTATAAYFARARWRWHVAPATPTDQHSIAELIVGWGPSLAIVLISVAFSWPPLERVLDAIVWTPVWVADVLWREIFFTDASRQQSPRRRPQPSDDPHTEELNLNKEQIIQQLKRVRDPSGREIIYGTIRADLAPGERTTSLHVSFCPPLDASPEFEIEQTDGPQSRIKAGQVLPYGARIDVRVVDELDAASSIEIEWAALAGGAGVKDD